MGGWIGSRLNRRRSRRSDKLWHSPEDNRNENENDIGIFGKCDEDDDVTAVYTAFTLIVQQYHLAI